MNTPKSPALPFIQSDNDFFHSSRDRVDATPPIASNIVFPLLDDIAVPAGTDRPGGRVDRLHRYNSILFFNHGDRLGKRSDELTTIHAISRCVGVPQLREAHRFERPAIYRQRQEIGSGVMTTHIK